MKYILHFNFVAICKNSIYNMADNNSNTFSNNCESETELPDFSTLKSSEAATEGVL